MSPRRWAEGSDGFEDLRLLTALRNLSRQLEESACLKWGLAGGQRQPIVRAAAVEARV